MTTCNTCNSPLIANKRGVLYCKPCASKRGKSVRAKGNTGQRSAAAVLRDAGLDVQITGIAQRRACDKSVPDLTVRVRTGTITDPECPNDRLADQPHYSTLRGEVKYLASLPKWLWPCPVCAGFGDMGLCPACKGAGRRGPMRPPALWWWDVLEGVRCKRYPGTCQDTDCSDCHGTGWLAHPHDFLMLRRIAKPGEAAYEWLVLVGAIHPGGLRGKSLMTIENDNEHHGAIWVYPADEWAGAI